MSPSKGPGPRSVGTAHDQFLPPPPSRRPRRCRWKLRGFGFPLTSEAGTRNLLDSTLCSWTLWFSLSFPAPRLLSRFSGPSYLPKLSLRAQRTRRRARSVTDHSHGPNAEAGYTHQGQDRYHSPLSLGMRSFHPEVTGNH